MDEGVSAHFDDDGRAAVDAALRVARDLNAPEITTEHLLAGVLQNADGALPGLLAGYGMTADAAARRVIAGRPDDPVAENPPFSQRVKEVLSLANTAANNHGHRIGCAHLFLGLLMRRDGAVIAFLRTKDEIDALTAAAFALVEPA